MHQIQTAGTLSHCSERRQIMQTMQSLPKFMTRDNTCCFTGHRNIPDNIQFKITNFIEQKIFEFYKKGYRYFMCGGAYGFDMLAEETIIKAIRNKCDIHLILAIPCRNQTEKWDFLPNSSNLLRRYLAIKGFADTIYYIRDFYVDGCMRERNQFMIDHSSACIAYCDETRRGGSMQTIGMARKAEITICNIFHEVNTNAQFSE